MAGLALPKFRWLLAGALAAGVWVVREDIKAPRPPERVPPVRSASAAPAKTSNRQVLDRTALNLPKAVGRPPMRPQNIVTGSIETPVKLRLVQTTTKVRVRAQAQATAPVVAMLEAGQTVRELARSGKWRLVMAQGRKGWVHADYLAPLGDSQRRPKLPVLGPATKQAKASANGKPARTQ
jgi:hypothetical protein